MAFEITRQEITKQANDLLKLFRQTRDQKFKDEELRLRRIVAELEAYSAGSSSVSQIIPGTNVTVSPTGGTGNVTINATTQTLNQVTTAGNTTTNPIFVGGITTPYVQLNTAATPTLQPGMFGWNDAFGTADLRLKGNNVTLQLGQEILARVVNKTGADLLESQYRVVRVRVASEGGAQGQRLAVVLAQGNNDPDSATTLGVVTEDIANNQEGFITLTGNVNNINTTGSLQGETWVDGDVLYLSPTTAGALTKVKPSAPNHTVIVGYVLYAHSTQGRIFVKVDNGYELDELHNVLINGIANNDLLQYDGTTQVWKNKTISAIFGGTPLVSVPTLAQVTTAGATTSNTLIYSGSTEAIRPNVDSVGSLGASNFRWGVVHSRALSSGTNTLDINSPALNLNDTSGNIKVKLFTSTGNVVIQNGGTFTDAGYRLDVQGNTRVNGGNTSADIPFIINNRFQFKGDGALVYGASSAHGRLTWDGSGAYFGGLSGYGVGIGANGVLNHLFITTSGNVGIGTTSPVYKVDVQGTTLAASSVRAQGSFDINPLAAPPAIGGFTLSAGTNLGVGVYYYFVVYVTALGETSASNTLTVTTTTGNTTVNLTGIPVSSDPRVTARKLYRTKVGGTSDNQWFLATISDNVTTTYTDSIADASLTGVGLQGYKVNTTARYFTVSGVQGMVIDQNLTALGRSAGNAIITSNGTAVRTVLVGAFAGQNITTGTSNVIVGQAGGSINTGSNNTLMGDLAGYNINSGSSNSIFGPQAGRFLTIGGSNLILGAFAGRYLADGTTQFTSGNNNVIVGPDIRMSTITDSNSIVIGWDARGLGSNTTVIGNSSTTFTSIPAGNMTIGGTTNAGFKLDVQGTLRSTGQATLAGLLAQRSDTTEAVISIYQNGAAAAAHLYSLGDGYLGWVGHTSTVSRRFAFESALANSGRNFGLYIYDSAGSNPTQVFYATKTHFYLGNTVNTNGSITAASAVARGVYISNALVAAANNDVLVGLDIAPTFTNGAFTGISRIPFRAYLDANSWTRYHNNIGSNYHTFEIRNDNVAGSGFASIQSQVQTRINYMQVYTPADSNTLFGVTRGGWAGNISENVSGMFFGTVTAADVIVGANNTATMRIFNSTRNVLIQNGGTFTDAGYRLDVNGTARIQSDLTVASLTTDGPVKSLSGMLVSVAGYTGSFTVPTNPPGMQTLVIQDGIITNVL